MNLSIGHIVGIVGVIAFITFIGVYSGKKVKSASDFLTGGKSAGSILVAGTIMGTLIGGASTIGTAQLAYTHGPSAWWFTIGSGVACLILGLAFVKPFRRSGCDTVQQMVSNEFGCSVGMVAAVSNIFGLFINIIVQLLSAMALLSSIFGFNLPVSATISAVLMTCYVLFGGVLGAGAVGVVKLVLLYVSVIALGLFALFAEQGLPHIINVLPADRYLNFLSRGAGIDIGSGLSVMMGGLCAQMYAQAIIFGKSDKAAKRGALISAVMVVPVGGIGVLAGLYMRANHPPITPAAAFPAFVMETMPPVFAGIILATLFVAVIASGSGIVLGLSTSFTTDIYKKYINKTPSDTKAMLINRLGIVIPIALALVLMFMEIKSTILEWSVMSLALKGAVVLIPLCAALFLKGRIDSRFVLIAAIFGTVSVLIGNFVIKPSFDPLFIGVAANIVFMGIGFVVRHMQKKKLNISAQEGV